MDEKGHITPQKSHEERQESHGKSHGSSEAEDWREVAAALGHALADRVFKVPLPFNDAATNTVLECEGARPCGRMTSQGRPSRAVEAALSAIAPAFETGLTALDSASAQPFGRIKEGNCTRSNT